MKKAFIVLLVVAALTALGASQAFAWGTPMLGTSNSAQH